MKVEFLTLLSGRCLVEEFLEGLDDKALSKVYKLIDVLEKEGCLPFPHARKINIKGLWELRVLSRGLAIRLFYMYWERDKIIFISGFIKKSKKTPQREIDKAMMYLKEAGAKL